MIRIRNHYPQPKKKLQQSSAQFFKLLSIHQEYFFFYRIILRFELSRL
jgi:hypothetical protein